MSGRSNLNIEEKYENYIFAVGIDKYHDNKIANLQTAKKDAEDFIQVLVDFYQFEQNKVFTLFDENATHRNLIGQLEKLVDIFNDKSSKKNLIVYYAGHGYYKGKSGFLIPHDGNIEDISTLFRNTTLKDYLSEIESHHSLLIMDCCYSGSILKQPRNVNEGYKYEENFYRLPSRKALTSGLIESVSDGFRDDNSPFAKAVVQFLRVNINKEKIAASELALYVQKTVPYNAKQQPYWGVLSDAGDLQGEFVFHSRNKIKVEVPIINNDIKNLLEDNNWFYLDERNDLQGPFLGRILQEKRLLSDVLLFNPNLKKWVEKQALDSLSNITYYERFPDGGDESFYILHYYYFNKIKSSFYTKIGYLIWNCFAFSTLALLIIPTILIFTLENSKIFSLSGFFLFILSFFFLIVPLVNLLMVKIEKFFKNNQLKRDNNIVKMQIHEDKDNIKQWKQNLKCKLFGYNNLINAFQEQINSYYISFRAYFYFNDSKKNKDEVKKIIKINTKIFEKYVKRENQRITLFGYTEKEERIFESLRFDYDKNIFEGYTKSGNSIQCLFKILLDIEKMKENNDLEYVIITFNPQITNPSDEPKNVFMRIQKSFKRFYRPN